MRVENIAHRLTECISRLCDDWGAGWALLAIIVLSLVLLVFAGKAQARSRD
ncbi:MAG: hypothetical protein ACYTE3_12025 [Planctomycetota bacterium]|jgi:hypothetical protein